MLQILHHDFEYIDYQLMGTLLGALGMRWLDSRGAVRIYRKLVYQKATGKPMGIYSENLSCNIIVPIWIEIHNEKNKQIVVRDFSLGLYCKGRLVSKLIQIDKQYIKKNGVEKEIYYGKEGKYSFDVSKNNFEKYELLLYLKKEDSNQVYDELKFQYYIGQKKYVKNFMKFDTPWEPMEIGVDKDWVEIN